ncbi:MAG TPA: LPS export ABC transporter permease LptG [Steroidobacteraceae bacterium]|nr:LPS export ABC transporter permease LptG [Steroidobacteraceae bacterium]
MKILDRYLIRTILLYSALVLGVLLTLGGLFVFIQQQDDIGVGTYGASDALLYTVLNLPQQAFELMPIAVLIGGLLGLGVLARGSELVVMRAAGISVTRLAASAAVAGLVIAVLTALLGEVVAPPLQTFARQQKAFSKFSDVSFAGSGSAWVKDGNMIVSVHEQSGDNLFGGVYIFRFTSPQELLSVGHAQRASLSESGGGWRLDGYTETRFEDERAIARPRSTLDLSTHVNPGFLGIAASEPRQLPSLGLLRLIRHLEANGLETGTYVFALWSRIARTCAVIVVALLAVPFALGPLRSSGAGARIVIGVLIGVVFFLVQRTLESGTIVFNLDPVILAWIPTGALALITVVLIARTR